MAKRKKASTPIRKRISRLEKRASGANIGADIGDTYGNAIRQRKHEQRKISGIYKEVASAGKSSRRYTVVALPVYTVM